MFLEKEKVSVIIPLYNEEKNIEPLYKKIENAFTDLIQEYEIIFIDDGSKDKTYEILKNIQVKNTRIKIIKFAKNYGQLYAFLAGFEFTKGGVIITMDGDLQNDPYDIPKLLKKIEEGFDVVNGWRWERKDPLVRKLISNFANWLIKIKTGIKLHDYGCALTAIRKEVIDKLRTYGKDARFIKPLLVGLANSVTEVKVDHHPRKTGRSKYNLLMIVKSGLDFIFNFTLVPKSKNNLPYIIEEVIGD